MQHLEVSYAVRPIYWPLGVKWLIERTFFSYLVFPPKKMNSRVIPGFRREVLVDGLLRSKWEESVVKQHN